MFDPEPAGVFELEQERDCWEWNRKGFGIFWAVNEFNGARRIANLTRIKSWAVDMDDGTKAEQATRITSAPLLPSLVVETKRGYQVYYRAKNALASHWNALVLHRLVPYFGADKNARDLARILRVPGFLHQKDPAHPFKVKTVHSAAVAYTEEQIARAFPDDGYEIRQATEHQTHRREYKSDGDFWERVYQLDCHEGLQRLSGHPAVGGESYTFRQNASGTRNILVDGKGTSCWVDRNGRIGSLADGGPTLYAWLRWFRNEPKECVRVLKSIFPHLEDRK